MEIRAMGWILGGFFINGWNYNTFLKRRFSLCGIKNTEEGPWNMAKTHNLCDLKPKILGGV